MIHTSPTLPELFKTFTRSAFRLETLSRYNVPNEAEDFHYFLEHDSLPTNRKTDWAKEVKNNITMGKTMKRLRLFTLPLNNYERFERLAYETNIKAGEQIHALDHAGIDMAQDFWTFDDKWIAWMVYDKTGAWERADVSEMTDQDHHMVSTWLQRFEDAPDIRVHSQFSHTDDQFITTQRTET